MQDQRAALKWVRENIASFGGASDAITIMGESAGASSVTLHLVQKESFPYFDRAIIESGAFNPWVHKPFSHAQDTFNAVVKALGCGIGSGNLVDCLLSKDTVTLLNVSDISYGNHTVLPWGDSFDSSQWAPPVDGIALSDYPSSLLKTGNFARDKHLLIGSNRDEGTFFTPLSRSVTSSALTAFLNATFAVPSSNSVAAAALKLQAMRVLYDPSKYPSPPAAIISNCSVNVCGTNECKYG